MALDEQGASMEEALARVSKHLVVSTASGFGIHGLESRDLEFGG